MNTINSVIRTAFATALIMFGLMLLTPNAEAQTYRKYAVSSNTTVVASGAVDLVNSVAIKVPYSGLSFQPYFAGTNSGTATISFGFATSVDGTNYNNADLNWYHVPMNGTTAVRGNKTWGHETFGQAQWLKLVRITNGHTSSIMLSNGWVGGYFLN